MVKIAIVLMLISVSAMAQQPRTEIRDPSGKLLGYTQKEGDRLVMRDPSGRSEGYWTREGNVIVHRDNAGRVLAREQIIR